MPSLKTIRKRISSVKSTQKITRAMKMVAGARLARAQSRILALRPYAVKTQDVLGSVVSSYGGDDAGDAVAREPEHPLLAVRKEEKIALVVLTSDRGLCGAFNTNINKAAEREWRTRAGEGQTVSVYTVGRKGRDYMRRRGAPVAHEFSGIWDNLDLSKARSIARTVLPPLLSGDVDAIYLVYNEFKSAMTQRVVVERLLPIVRRTETPAVPAGAAVEYIFEPNKTALLERLVPMYV